MKLAEHANKLATNNEEAEVQNFGIGDVSVIIDILRNRLYEKKVQTTVQEYVSNGRDACREAGKPDHLMEITIPTHLSPTFKVRDFGVGITPDRMADVFIKYGASTKRADNVQTGGLGIGGKSFFSYTDSFSIVTYLDGVRRSYIAHIGTNNSGRLDLVSTESTTEKNGTEIIGAVNRNDVNEFRDAVLRVVYFWKDKPKLRGITDVPTTIAGYTIGNNLEVIDAGILPAYTDPGYGNEILAVIDGIPYPVGQKLMNKCPTLQSIKNFIKKKAILTFGNGVVEVAASRESIADSPKSVEALEKLAKKVALEIKTHISDRFASVKSTPEYIKIYGELNKYFTVESGFAKYNGYSINNHEIASDDLNNVRITTIHCLDRRMRNRIAKITKSEHRDHSRRIPLDMLNNIYFLRSQESGVLQNKRVREHFLNNNKLILLEILPPPLPIPAIVDKVTGKVITPASVPPTMAQQQASFDKVIADLGVKDFQSLKYTVLPKEQRVKITKENSVICLHLLEGYRYGVGGRYFDTTLATNKEKWLYVPITSDGKGDLRETKWETACDDDLKDLAEYVKEKYGFRICGIASKGLKMIQGNANFSPLKQWLVKWKPTAKEIAQAKAKKTSNNTNEHYSLLSDVKGINDDRITEWLKEYKDLYATACVVPRILLEKVNEEKEVKDFAKMNEKIQVLFAKHYPLLEELTCSAISSRSEIVWYLNAKYVSAKKVDNK